MKFSINQEEFTSEPKYHYLVNSEKSCFADVNVTHSNIIQNDTNNVTDSDLYCPRTFDGWMCWDETPAGATALQSCPAFVIDYNSQRNVSKRCTENGTWLVHPNTSTPWMDYITCIDVDDLNFKNIIKNVYIAGYTISTVVLLLLLILLIYYGSRQCIRIQIHKHLSISMILNNILWIIWYTSVVNNFVVVQNNEIWCQIHHIVTVYFMLSSYFWMFCDGLHFHLSLFVVFVRHHVPMRWMKAVGWILPTVITAIYSITRCSIPGETERCWMNESITFCFIAVPVIISLGATFVCLIKALRILCMTLYEVPNQRLSQYLRRAARAALILIPLFGIHFMLVPWRPKFHPVAEKTYEILKATITNFQGVCVALLVCFTNPDILNAICRLFRTSEAIPMAEMTGVRGRRIFGGTRENVV
ncbi:unnamed protein product [Parnassius mnemosyne]|uniref:Calcitonin receptor n=1 Tax=Parnassius mnemosyne TaxID=213953 RepID=A0AAV1L3U2_9NEOP